MIQGKVEDIFSGNAGLQKRLGKLLQKRCLAGASVVV